MSDLLDNILENLYLYLAIIVFITLIVVLIITKPKKVKPIDLEEIEKEERPKTDIEKVLESLQENKESRPMTTFEEEQEANAIISYQELVEAVRLKKEMNGIDLKPVEKPTPVENIQPVTEIKPPVETKPEIESKPIENMTIEVENLVEDVITNANETKKFKNSEFISPIFGKDSSKDNDEFLKELKDFRSNL